MIFATPNAIPMIIRGEKTQTRRTAKAGDYLRDGCVYTAEGRLRYKTGATYAVIPKMSASAYQHEGQPLRIKVIDISYDGSILDITHADARAEGGYTPDEYVTQWIKFFKPVLGRKYDKAVQAQEQALLDSFWDAVYLLPATVWEAWKIEFEVSR